MILEQRSDHHGELIRRQFRAAVFGSSGVIGTGDLLVAQHSTPNMSVDVAAGEVVMPGTESTFQGFYYALNDALYVKTIATSDATNPRWDLVVAAQRDDFYSTHGGTPSVANTWDIYVITGTPAPSPALPGTPTNAVTLAKVVVPANSTTVVNANITDLRPVLPITTAGLVTGAALKATGIAGLTNPTSGRWIGAWTTAGSPAGGPFVAGDYGFDSNGFEWACTLAGSPGTWKTFPGGTLAGGYLEVTANQGPTAGSFDITGLGATVTTGSGRRIRIGGLARFANTVAGTQQQFVVAEGATQLSIVTVDIVNSARQYSAPVEVFLTPTAGSHTYKLVAISSAGNTTMQAAAGSAAFIHVSDVGV